MQNPQHPDDHDWHHDHPDLDAARAAEIQRERAAELAREQVVAVWQQPASTPIWFWNDQGQAIYQLPTQRGDGKMGFNLGQLITTLTNAGLTPAVAAQAIQTLAVNSPNNSVMAICNVILANSNNPSVIKDECVKLAEIPNLPQSVAVLIPSLAAATDPVQVMNIVHMIEQNVRGNGTFTLGGSGF